MEDIVWTQVEQQAENDLAGLIFRCEHYFDQQVEALAGHLYEMDDMRLILVAGPSSSGKTTFSRLLCEQLEKKGVKTHYIGMDDFFINRADVPYLPSGLRDYDSLAALDVPLFRQVLGGVLNAEWVELPHYDFVTGERSKAHELLRLHEQDIVMVEGIHALNPVLLEGLDTGRIARVGIMPRRTFVMPNGSLLMPDDLRLLRRTIRDYHTRAHSFDDTAKQWVEVCAAESVHIRPFMRLADFNVDSSYDYELFLYKHCLKNMMDRCDLPAFFNVREALMQVRDIPMTQIPTTSLLNEFVFLQ